MRLRRLMQHLFVPHWWAVRVFPPSALAAIESAVTQAEREHCGELRVVIEGPLPWSVLWAGESVRERAISLFSSLRVWDTQDNSGVLIYVQLLDQQVEIVADRGIDSRVGAAFWSAVCQRMQTAFAAGCFQEGVLQALGEIAQVLAAHFPVLEGLPAAGGSAASNNANNELPDKPLVL